MAGFFWGIFLYVATLTIISAFGSPLWVAVATVLYAGCLLVLFCLKAPYRNRMLVGKGGLAPAIPLLIFAAANVIFLKDFPASAAWICVAAGAVAEELLFRGLLFSALEKKSRQAAIWGSTVLFGVYHLLDGDLFGALCALCFGFALAVYVCRYRSVVPCIAAHLLTNLFGSRHVPWWLLVLCCVICVLYGYILYPKRKEN